MTNKFLRLKGTASSFIFLCNMAQQQYTLAQIYDFDQSHINKILAADRRVAQGFLFDRLAVTILLLNANQLSNSFEQENVRDVAFTKLYLFDDDTLKSILGRPNAKDKHTQLIRLILLKFNKYKDYKLNIALIKYARRGNAPAVEILIIKGASVSTDDERPLIKAALYGHITTIEMLLRYGAIIFINNDQPLVSAASRGHIDTVRFLLSKDATNIDGALDAAISNDRAEMTGLLLDAGATISANDLNYALRLDPDIFDYNDTMKLLFSRGLDINVLDPDLREKYGSLLNG